jgi:hypothetical protein
LARTVVVVVVVVVVVEVVVKVVVVLVVVIVIVEMRFVREFEMMKLSVPTQPRRHLLI